MKKTKNQIYGYTGVFILLIGILAMTSSAELATEAQESKVIPRSSALTPHAPFDITSSNYLTLVSSEGWPGDGSFGDPYRIENYSIDVGAAIPGISIVSVPKAFLIQNCHIFDGDYGISFSGAWVTVKNCTVNLMTSDGINGMGTFIGNEIYDCNNGISTAFSVEAIENYIHDCGQWGIGVGPDSFIYKNVVIDCAYEIYSWTAGQTSSSTILNNLICNSDPDTPGELYVYTDTSTSQSAHTVNEGNIFTHDGDGDGDGLSDYAEFFTHNTDRFKVDSDDDNILDGVEIKLGTDPNDDQDPAAGTTLDLTEVWDALEGNMTLVQEVIDDLGISVGDTDYDGLDDITELSLGTDINCIDSDTDNLNDAYEVKIGTDPLDDDTDGDGVLDGHEVQAGSDPLDASSLPHPDSEDPQIPGYLPFGLVSVGFISIFLIARKIRS